MTDVRLTATNPEDSSVVPVACNAKGELLLEETPAFDGNVDGDLTVSGGGTFAGNLDIGESPNSATESGVRIGAPGSILINRIDDSGAVALSIREKGSANSNINMQSDGTATFEDRVNAAAFHITDSKFPGDNDELIRILKNGERRFVVNQDGSGSFAGDVTTKDLISGLSDNGNTGAQGFFFAGAGGNSLVSRFRKNTSGNPAVLIVDSNTVPNAISFKADGSAEFSGDVIVGSRGKQWMLLEQGGLCHMVEQQTLKDGYPELRNVLQELDLIEKALGEVMEKLRMSPPSGWEVWDGSSENS